MKVGVLFGGTSSERDVSVASAAQVVKALKLRGHTVVPVDCERGVLSTAEAEELLSHGISTAPPILAAERRYAVDRISTDPELRSLDVMFLALHGGEGENGTVQGLLDLLGIPYTGSPLRGSSLAIDKDITKRLVRAAGVPTADWFMAPIDIEATVGALGLPLIVKPNSEGSTVGLSVVRRREELAPAIATAQRYDHEVMIERFVPGRELTVGIIDGQTLPVGEIFPLKADHFDYESKYQPGGAREEFPANLAPAVAEQLQSYALQTWTALKLKGYCRVDFRLDPSEQAWLLEVNTLPGMTATSLLPQGAQAKGIAFGELCEKICELGIRRAELMRTGNR
jgi:D-alanine-D-alanine ligase